MANFDKAILKVINSEGGYVNDPADKGGETYKGISRKNWPRWSGWAIIDCCKSNPNWPECLNSFNALKESVKSFYRNNFWDKVGGDGIKDQDIAYKLVDTAVLEGIKPAVRRAQMICGIVQTGDFSDELKKKLNSF